MIIWVQEQAHSEGKAERKHTFTVEDAADILIIKQKRLAVLAALENQQS